MSQLGNGQVSEPGPDDAGSDPAFLKVPEPKSVKNRLHLDLRCESFETEKARLTGLGAIVVGQYDTFVVLSDPEGNEFCLSRRTGR